MRVGFIGLGIMSAPVAMNILKDGHPLTVYNRSPEKTRPFVGAGAKVVASPAEIDDVDVLVTCVADDLAEEDVVFSSGLIDRMPKTSVDMSSTTVGIGTARRLAEAHRAHGRQYVAAPVLGRAASSQPVNVRFTPKAT